MPIRAMFLSSNAKAPLSTRSIRHVIARAGELAGLPFEVHPHQRRHVRRCFATCGQVLCDLAPQGTGTNVPRIVVHATQGECPDRRRRARMRPGLRSKLCCGSSARLAKRSFACLWRRLSKLRLWQLKTSKLERSVLVSIPLRLAPNGALRQRREATLLPREAVGLTANSHQTF